MSTQLEDHDRDEAKESKRETEDEVLWKAVMAHLQLAISLTDAMRVGRHALGEALCVAIDMICAGAPKFQLFSDLRKDAEWWADTATPFEIEVYMAAGLRRITRTTFAPAARKRLFWMIWKSFSDADQRKFLESQREKI